MKTSSFRFWACPATGQPLLDEGRELKSETSPDLVYPKIGGVPWLFPDPRFVLANWRERIDFFLEMRSQEIEELKGSIKSTASPLTKARLEALRQSKITQLELLKKVLDPIKPGTKLSLPKKQAFGYRLPFNQGLLGYFPNLARDWAIGANNFETENITLLEAVLAVTPAATKTSMATSNLKIAVLGCGAGRLPYDIAKMYSNCQVMAVDINPLLLLAAQQINSGAKLKGIYPTVSPKDRMQPALELELAAPKGPATNLEFVFADVYALPFLPASFDVVITPWLVDILPRQFSQLTASIAQITKPEGIWINCGAWAFNFQNEEDNLSLAEAEEVGSQSGWNPLTSQLIETAYLQTEIDSHRRFETMTAFAWQRSGTPVTYDSRARLSDKIEWLTNPSLPIPRLPAFAQSIESLSTMTWVLSQVDGKRTLTDLIATLSQQSGLDQDAARDALESFFDRYLKDRTFRERT